MRPRSEPTREWTTLSKKNWSTRLALWAASISVFSENRSAYFTGGLCILRLSQDRTISVPWSCDCSPDHLEHGQIFPTLFKQTLTFPFLTEAFLNISPSGYPSFRRGGLPSPDRLVNDFKGPSIPPQTNPAYLPYYKQKSLVSDKEIGSDVGSGLVL